MPICSLEINKNYVDDHFNRHHKHDKENFIKYMKDYGRHACERCGNCTSNLNDNAKCRDCRKADKELSPKTPVNKLAPGNFTLNGPSQSVNLKNNLYKTPGANTQMSTPVSNRRSTRSMTKTQNVPETPMIDEEFSTP